METISSTHCTVLVLAPSGRQFTFADTAAADSDLIAVETSKDIGEACGSFTLHFAPTIGPDGRTWAQRIPRRSLVAIEMLRDQPTGSHPDAATVMLGFTDDHTMTSSWQEARPHRTVQVSGRDLGSIIVDAMLWFHPGLSEDPSLGTMTEMTRALGAHVVALTYNPNLSQYNEDPRLTIKRLLEVYLFQGMTAIAPQTAPGLQHPVIGVDIPGLTLSNLLDINDRVWSLFEEGITVPIPQTPNEVGSLWNLLHLYIDRNFQEFFTRVEDGVVKIHFRGKPFAHKTVLSGTRFKTTDETLGTLKTLRLDASELLAEQRTCQTQHVYNVFMVNPLGMTDFFHAPSVLYEMLPQIVKEVGHPSFIGRYGLRIMNVTSMYLTPMGKPGPGTMAATPQQLGPQPQGAEVWAPKANEIAAAQGVPAEHRPWFVALIHRESAFKPNAEGKVLRDLRQALGIAQFVQPYVRPEIGLVDPRDPINALESAARYWNQLRALPYIGNDPRLIVAAYNAGPGAVQQYKGIPPFAETQKHVRMIEGYVPRYTGLAGTAPSATPTYQTGSAAIPTPTAKPAIAEGQPYPEMIETAKQWAAILRTWYDMGGELFGGTIVVRGDARWNIGHRLLARDELGEWEAYIEGVQHRYDCRTGQYLTSLRITRGWYLDPAITNQLWKEGRTTVVETSGGPPTLNAETGDVQGPVFQEETLGPPTVEEVFGGPAISPNELSDTGRGTEQPRLPEDHFLRRFIR